MPWTRRDFVIASVGGLAAGALPRALRAGPAGAVRSARGPRGLQELRELRRNVGIYVARGGTIGWLANDAGGVVVDSQYPDTAATCVGLLEERGALPLDVLLNTHHHGDHTAGNGAFRESVGLIVAQQRVPELQRRAAEAAGGAERPVLPDMTFGDGWRFDVGDELVHARHYGPAHTGGDCTVHFERADVVHMGDLVFNRAYPFIDRAGGASVRGWIALLEAVAAEHSDATIFVFGHANPAFEVTGGRADVLVQRDFLAAVLEEAERAVAAGASRDEATDRARLPGFEDHEPLGARLNLGAALGAAYDEVREGAEGA